MDVWCADVAFGFPPLVEIVAVEATKSLTLSHVFRFHKRKEGTSGLEEKKGFWVLVDGGKAGPVATVPVLAAMLQREWLGLGSWTMGRGDWGAGLWGGRLGKSCLELTF